MSTCSDLPGRTAVGTVTPADRQHIFEETLATLAELERRAASTWADRRSTCRRPRRVSGCAKASGSCGLGAGTRRLRRSARRRRLEVGERLVGQMPQLRREEVPAVRELNELDVETRFRQV
jgi:hypothetical protein